LSFDGAWANKDGKKWMENQRYIGWGNNDWQSFVNTPQEIKSALYDAFVDHLDEVIKVMQSNYDQLVKEGKFKYRMDANNAGWSQAEDFDGSDAKNIFMPSVSESKASPLLGGDVTKWRVAMEYLGMPVPKRRSRKQSAGNNSSNP
jgi:hypothetical protein